MTEEYLSWMQNFLKHDIYSRCIEFSPRFDFTNTADDIRTCCKKYEEMCGHPLNYMDRQEITNWVLDIISSEIRSEAQDFLEKLKEVEVKEYRHKLINTEAHYVDLPQLIELHGQCTFRLTQDYINVLTYRNNCEKAYNRRH